MKNIYKYLIILVYIIVSLYLLNYSFGEDREDLFSGYGYLFIGGIFIVLCFIYFSSYINIRIYIDSVGVSLFLIVNYLSLVTAIFYGQFLNIIVMIGGQVIIFINILLLYYVLKIEKEKLFNLIIHSVLILSILACVFGIYAYLNGIFSYGPLSIDNTHTSRLTSWFGSPNRTSSFFAVSILSTIYFLVIKNSKSVLYSSYLYFALVLNLVCLILTGSRGAWIAFVLATFVLTYCYLLKFSFKVSTIVKVVGVILILLISGNFYLISYGFDAHFFLTEIVRVESFQQQIDLDREGYGRAYYWRKTYEVVFGSHIIQSMFGHGFGSLVEIVGRSPHSGYLNFIIDRGVLNFIVFMILIIYSISFSAKRIKKHYMYSLILSIIVYIAIKNFTNNDLPNNSFTGMVYLFLIAILFIKEKKILWLKNG